MSASRKSEATSRRNKTAYMRAYAQAHPEKFSESMQRRRALRRVLVDGVLAKSRCRDCGERDRVVLEFDHVKGEKVGNISRMVLAAMSEAMILEEIAKCEVVCANCHRRRTHRRNTRT